MGGVPPEYGRASGRRRWWRMALLAVVVAAALGGLFLWPERHRVALPPPAVAFPSSPSASPSKVLPYPYFPPGTCFDHQQLSTGITKPEQRPCAQPHDGEAIANVVLPEGLTDDLVIGRALRGLCQAPLTEWEREQGGGQFYGFPIGPYLKFYQQGFRDATCTMTVSDQQGGPKTTGHFRSQLPADG